ncbi:MAG: hypothetical protein AB7E80_09125 [Hyphomicrobiaceae bacterium]
MSCIRAERLAATSALSLLVPLAAAFAALAVPQSAHAHSKGACVDAVVESCNATYPNNYQARIACTNNGITQCNSHTHSGGGRPKPGADSFSSSSGGGIGARTRTFRLLR